VPDGPAALAALLAPGFDPLREVILEGDGEAEPEPAATGAPGGPRVAIERYLPERVELTVEAPAAGWLVLSDLFYPGWRATRDGAPARVERANHLFRAVRVGAGASRVVFEFRPASLRIGAGVSAATALALTALALRGRPRAAEVV
jgi:hypothetical protein